MNTYWLMQYIAEHYVDVDLDTLIQCAANASPGSIENLHTGELEPICLEHLKNPRYWFSHSFVRALHNEIERQIQDPHLGYKIGSTMYKTQPVIKTALGIPLLGVQRVAKKVSSEAEKYNRTKQYHIIQLEKGLVEIRIIHNPGIVISEFPMQWNAGCFASYARLAGATNIRVSWHCVEPGPKSPDEDSQAIWDIKVRFKEPSLLTRLTKIVFSRVAWIRELTDKAEAVEKEHQEQIYSRDRIIKARTAELSRMNNAMRDEIAERKRTQQELIQRREELQRYVTAIDDIGIGLCVVGLDYKIEVLNDTSTKWFNNCVGDSCYSAIMGNKSPCSFCRLDEVISGKQKVRYLSTLDDGRIFEMVATPITHSNGKVLQLTVIRNVTQQKRQEQQRLLESRQQEQLKKLESLKTMAGAIAHRFNNSMVSVMGNLELMTLTFAEGSEEHQMASNAFQSARGASQVGSMMMRYVGQQPLQLCVTNLFDLIRDVLKEANDKIPTKATLTVERDNANLLCKVDRPQIVEVVRNVLLNSAEALPEGGGSIRIAIGKKFFHRESFALRFQDEKLRDNTYIFCRIEDDGCGICEEDLFKIFDPFFTTKFLGRGLGLALTAGILQAHGGALTVDSKLGCGTTIHILLPFVEALQTDVIDSAVVDNSRARLSGIVLLVDDDPGVLEVGRKILEILGFEVQTAGNGREAVEIFTKEDITFRLVILDISMPEMDGLTAMKLMRKINPDIPIILCSGYSEGELGPLNKWGPQPDGFMSKPFHIAKVQATLLSILG